VIWYWPWASVAARPVAAAVPGHQAMTHPLLTVAVRLDPSARLMRTDLTSAPTCPTRAERWPGSGVMAAGCVADSGPVQSRFTSSPVTSPGCGVNVGGVIAAASAPVRRSHCVESVNSTYTLRPRPSTAPATL